jgi:ribosome-binding protein aMBF1 (putative translation factor)
MIDHDEKTPVDATLSQPTLEMVLRKLDDVGHDTKLAVKEAREAKGHSQNTYNLQVELNQRFNRLEMRVRAVEVTRYWPAALALVALVVSALALLKAW